MGNLEIRAKLADLGLDSFVRGAAFWEGEHVFFFFFFFFFYEILA